LDTASPASANDHAKNNTLTIAVRERGVHNITIAFARQYVRPCSSSSLKERPTSRRESEREGEIAMADVGSGAR
jgi:hypothetical protein